MFVTLIVLWPFEAYGLYVIPVECLQHEQLHMSQSTKNN
jgi:hypothetical protein